MTRCPFVEAIAFDANGGPQVLRRIAGLEVSGVEVSGFGAGVDGLAVGHPVAANLPDLGGYAELTVTRAEFVLPLPDGLDLVVAGGFGCVAPTGYGIAAAAGRVGAGDTVLIHAAGGVGSLAGGQDRAARRGRDVTGRRLLLERRRRR